MRVPPESLETCRVGAWGVGRAGAWGWAGAEPRAGVHRCFPERTHRSRAGYTASTRSAAGWQLRRVRLAAGACGGGGLGTQHCSCRAGPSIPVGAQVNARVRASHPFFPPFVTPQPPTPNPPTHTPHTHTAPPHPTFPPLDAHPDVLGLPVLSKTALKLHHQLPVRWVQPGARPLRIGQLQRRVTRQDQTGLRGAAPGLQRRAPWRMPARDQA